MNKDEYKADYVLVHRYLCGDRDAGEELFWSIDLPVRRFIKKHTYGYLESEREDIYGDAMVRCVEKLGEYRGDSSFTTFACKITRYIILEHARKKNKGLNSKSLDELHESEFDGDSESETVISFSLNPEHYVVRKETQEEVQAVLDSLPSEYKDILILRYINKVPFKKISEIFGESVDALESRNRRAVNEFRKRIKNI